MKVSIKKSDELCFFQKCDDNSDKLNKLVGHLTQLPKGDKDVVELECNGHKFTFNTDSVDITTVAKIANGVIVKNPLESLLGKKPVAAAVTESAE